MDHKIIEDELWVERYVRGDLGPEEAASFEEHYLECRPCLEAVEAAEGLARGLRQVAAEDSLQLALLRHGARRAWLARIYPFAAALATLVALGLGLRLASVEKASLQRSSGNGATTLAQVNTAILPLSPLRSEATADSTHGLTLGPEPEWIVLALALDGLPEAAPGPGEETYTLRLERGSEPVWMGAGLRPDTRGELVVSLHSSLLEPGPYQLLLASPDDAGGRVLARYSLHIRSASPR